MRHRSNARIYPRFLPHRKQRLTTLDENFGFRAARARTDFFAINNIVENKAWTLLRATILYERLFLVNLPRLDKIAEILMIIL